MLSIYQNSNADNYENVKTGFIVRKLEYETIISSLEKRKAGDSIQHELILGRRGSGKSTLLKRIEVEIAENEKLRAKYIPVNLAEEQAGIYRLMDLWEQVLQELYCQNDEKQEVKSFSEFTGEQAFTRYLYGEIHSFCEKKKKKAVLLLDNFDRIVGSFSDDGNLLRETLINYNDLVLIAASTRMDEHFWQYNQPFYEFFRRHHLESLSSEETFLLLNHWGNSPDFDYMEREKIKDFLKKYPGKVENIRLLTDGLPRTMQFFLKLVLQTKKLVEVDFLKKVMDEVTPLYQERLQNQTPPMRKIILEMAFMWEAASTKEIAGQCRMESNLVSANLNTLVDRNIVEIIATGKRNNLYRISERFFNIWLIVTQGTLDQKRKARWMTEFLEIWYEKQELQSIPLKNIENAKMYEVSDDDTTGLNDYEIIDNPRHTVQEPSVEYQILTSEKRGNINKKWGTTKKDLDILILEIRAGIFYAVEERAVAACSEKREDAWFIERLLILHQKNLVDKLFHNADFGKRMQEQYTVLYYVSQILNGKENENNLRLRIPPELESTVEDVLQKIKAEQEKYSK